ncbi:MAG: TPM domain-containing protein [Candidatus Binatia bacterium]
MAASSTPPAAPGSRRWPGSCSRRPGPRSPCRRCAARRRSTTSATRCAAEAWKVGKKGEDTGVLVLVAVDDRTVRVVTGYGVEGVLPDGPVGAIQDREMVPEFRAGRMGEGIWRGVAAMAQRIAAERGVALAGVPAPRQAPRAQEILLWLIVLAVALLIVVSRAAVAPRHPPRRRPDHHAGRLRGRARGWLRRPAAGAAASVGSAAAASAAAAPGAVGDTGGKHATNPGRSGERGAAAQRERLRLQHHGLDEGGGRLGLGAGDEPAAAP